MYVYTCNDKLLSAAKNKDYIAKYLIMLILIKNCVDLFAKISAFMVCHSAH